MPDLSLVIVNYFSAELARQAIESARRTTQAALQVIVVDNSMNCDEAARLESVGADELIVAPDNDGYSGGANRGVAVASTPVVVVSNPDVVFGEACLDRLADQVSGDVAIAGPAFHWDTEGRWLLPPTDVLGFGEVLARVLSSRFQLAAVRRDRARTKHRVDFWRNDRTRPVEAVAGAVMAIDREKLNGIGGFDTDFELYFEEIDLARRLRARGWQVLYVPEAACRHLYNQSAAFDSNAAEKFARSEQRYLRKWSPGALPLRAMVASRSAADEESTFHQVAPDEPIELPSIETPCLIEASPYPSFDSAAGCFAAAESVRFPEDIWSLWGMESLYLRVLDPETIMVTRRYVIRK